MIGVSRKRDIALALPVLVFRLGRTSTGGLV
jgi:hypothetical protein